MISKRISPAIKLLIKRKEQRVRRKAAKTVESLKFEILVQKKLCQKWKKRYQRLLKSTAQTQSTPEKKVEETLQKGSEYVKRQLLFGEALVSQLTENKKKMITEQDKSIFAKVLSGRVLKKHKVMNKLSGVVSNYKQRKYSNDKSLTAGRSKKQKQKIHSIITETVRDFLEQDVNSTPAPGAKDCITKYGKTVRKRFLLDSLDNLYKKFQIESLIKISRSTFFRVKPFWVVNRAVTSRDTCLCKEHANFNLILQRLIALKVLTIKKTIDLLSMVTCDPSKRVCMYRECNVCKNRDLGLLADKRSSWYFQWQTKTEDRIGAKGQNYHVKITSKEKIEASVEEIVLQLNAQTPSFLKHSFNNTHQHKTFLDIQNDLKMNEVFMVVDFSENYYYKYGSAIQSVHFGASKKQVSLYTGAFVYRNESNELNNVSFCTVSDCLRHDAAAIWAHLKPVLNLINLTVKKVLALHIQSDGPSTQYKNKTNFFLFKLHCKELGLSHATWNFSVSGHGKSRADGVGGTVKNMCNRAVGNEKDVICIDDIKGIVSANKDCKIKIFEVHESQMKEVDNQIMPDLKPIPKTRDIHQIIWSKENTETLYLNYLSCSKCIYLPPCTHFGLSPKSFIFSFENNQDQLEINAEIETSNDRGKGRKRGRGKAQKHVEKVKKVDTVQEIDTDMECEENVLCDREKSEQGREKGRRGRGRGKGRGRGSGSKGGTN